MAYLFIPHKAVCVFKVFILLTKKGEGTKMAQQYYEKGFIEIVLASAGVDFSHAVRSVCPAPPERAFDPTAIPRGQPPWSALKVMLTVGGV